MISRGLDAARLLLPVTAGLIAVAAQAQHNLPSEVKISWEITEVAEPRLAFDIARKVPEKVATARPQGLVALEQPAVRAKGSSAIPAGTVFAPSIIGTGVICEPGRRPGQDTIACLADSDGDARFDHAAKVQTRFIEWDSMTKIGFLVDVNPVSPWQPLGSPVSAATIGDVPATAKMIIELTLTWLKSGKDARFSLCAMKNEGKDVWGGNIIQPFCAPELKFPGGRGQQPLSNLPGGSLTLVSVGKSSARILLDPPKVGTTY